jgi:hypothetical protein
VRLLAGYEDEARTGLARMPRWVRDSAALEPRGALEAPR